VCVYKVVGGVGVVGGSVSLGGIGMACGLWGAGDMGESCGWVRSMQMDGVWVVVGRQVQLSCVV
jgi:hypothetical protein